MRKMKQINAILSVLHKSVGQAVCHWTSIRLFVVYRKNWSPSWVVLVGNSLVFFKDPKSQTPSSWVRALVIRTCDQKF